ncbi:GreA/GreB family elongation factor [Sphingomonas montanisoli]|uniref:Nucleoside-diphosphate kinase n=1 Tax=Sphingomonas montanisoli TaxID=2606412 RepID=A0A5D9CAL8_9SPHN|nr:GreA/GreB family elongation factor [Sphingomonas montanisoli]TZG28834.1 nucleoside-diphosphate kinase [Sphingomonas montanisoli]
MSVAFRREGDDEHLEPKFELPIPPGPNLVTENGLKLIEARVDELEARVAQGGDDETLKPIKRDLRYWRTRKATAVVQPLADGEEAAFGTRVRYRLNGKTNEIAIVGDDEADPAAGLISFSSPIARALIGAYEGERVDFAGRAEAIEILEITPL